MVLCLHICTGQVEESQRPDQSFGSGESKVCHEPFMRSQQLHPPPAHANAAFSRRGCLFGAGLKRRGGPRAAGPERGRQTERSGSLEFFCVAKRSC